MGLGQYMNVTDYRVSPYTNDEGTPTVNTETRYCLDGCNPGSIIIGEGEDAETETFTRGCAKEQDQRRCYKNSAVVLIKVKMTWPTAV